MTVAQRLRRSVTVTSGALMVLALLSGAGSLAAAETTASASGSNTSSVASLTQPLAVVMDLSSSMTESDTDGVVKLDGARSALTQVLRGQTDRSEVGVWTFPAPGDSCSVGGWLGGQDPRPRTDPGALIASVRGLSASGDTPTAAALAAVGASLAGRGPVTVLLVSDGESNCDGDPCDAAKSLVSQGLDVTVQAMGFRISNQGRDELQCIAGATGGGYYDVQDAEQLVDLVEQATVPALVLDVTATDRVPAGTNATITATVTNPSEQAVADVSVGLSFTGVDSQSLFPAVVPPRYRLGNVNPGQTIVRSWTMSTSGARTGTADWVVVASSAGTGSLPRTGTFTVTDEQLTLDDAGPALQEVLDHGDVLVLGDSYSSGEGTKNYTPLASAKQTLCHRSASAYGPELFGALTTDMVACSGAVTSDLLVPQPDRDGLPAQLKQVRESGVKPSAVLLTFGGNDVQFSSIVKRCYFGKSIPVIEADIPLPRGDDCVDDVDFIASVDRGLGEVSFSLENAFRNVWSYVNSPEMIADRGGWVAPVIVLPYPQALPDHRRITCMPTLNELKVEGLSLGSLGWGFSTREIRWANGLIASLDAQVDAAVRTVHEDGLAVYYVPDVENSTLPDHTMCDEEPYINPISGDAYKAGARDAKNGTGEANEYVHPNVDGHRAMANALISWSRNLDDGEQEAPLIPEAPVADVSDPVATVQLDGTSSAEITVSAGDSVTVEVTGMAPGTSIKISIHSTPRTLAVLDAGEDVSASTVVYVPPDLASGRHTLHAQGYDADGTFVDRSTPVRVRPAHPAWFWVAGGLAALGVAGGVFLVQRRLRARRGGVAAGTGGPS